MAKFVATTTLTKSLAAITSFPSFGDILKNEKLYIQIESNVQ